ncbi:unnamed protein product [Darwinula stevensoni]|uniref:Uncharacterized protein n=1 Tax=Darwinula stevensoni TaxID=69355 RepID=A0A7R9A0G8_9CRUS|nr:unnamed protein product [Darwinula stevensoni]CAG0881076.1 unnamed protein product [Darwinula stevensoni]
MVPCDVLISQVAFSCSWDILLCRIVEDFYASDEEVRETARRRGKHIPISLIKTLPSVLVFLAASIPVFLTEFGRKIYLDIWLYGSVLSYSWLAIKAVC